MGVCVNHWKWLKLRSYKIWSKSVRKTLVSWPFVFRFVKEFIWVSRRWEPPPRCGHKKHKEIQWFELLYVIKSKETQRNTMVCNVLFHPTWGNTRTYNGLECFMSVGWKSMCWICFNSALLLFYAWIRAVLDIVYGCFDHVLMVFQFYCINVLWMC